MRIASILSSLILLAGCTSSLEIGEGSVSSLTLSLKGGTDEAPVGSVKVWAFRCDAQGAVSKMDNVAYGESEGQPSLSMDLSSDSRYYMVLAGVNLPSAAFGEGASFASLRSSKFAGRPDDDALTGWTVVDMAEAEGGHMDVSMEVAPVCGRLTLNVAKSSETMVLRVDEVAVHSSGAPSQGLYFAGLTGQGTDLNHEPYSSVVAKGADVSGKGAYSCVATAFLYEHTAGWSDLSAFREAGWSLDPSVADPDCAGYYMSISYRYVTVPDASLDSEEAVLVKKYIPLAPVLRGNEYKFNVMVSLDGVTVSGSTEVSEEVQGQW